MPAWRIAAALAIVGAAFPAIAEIPTAERKSGYDFMSLVDAILAVSGASDAPLTKESLELLAQVTEPRNIAVFVTPT